MPRTTDRLRSFVKDNFLLSNDSSRRRMTYPWSERGVLDSTGILELISFVEQEYGVTVSPGELIPENFDSVRRISCFLEGKLVLPAIERHGAIHLEFPNSSIEESPPTKAFENPDTDR